MSSTVYGNERSLVPILRPNLFGFGTRVSGREPTTVSIRKHTIVFHRSLRMDPILSGPLVVYGGSTDQQRYHMVTTSDLFYGTLFTVFGVEGWVGLSTYPPRPSIDRS